ncbi:DPH4-like protein [Trichoplax sp. H2]|nr:DPH4-like protein [Trichoplax sp. H2]|eukprot:RDD41071.1 DPH4-like protein [Trichoplax sp. H2]
MSEYDLYEVLKVNPTASLEEIKRSYHSLVKQWHPDKLDCNSAENDVASAIYDRIDKAWQTLSKDELRKKYDQQRREVKVRQEYPINDDVDIDDMEYHEDGNYSYDCRCGGCYIISENNLEAGIDIAPCTTCTLAVRVLYSVINDSDGDNCPV